MVPFIALFSWPMVVAALFASTRLPVALVASVLGGYLILPPLTELDLPLLPTLDKYTLPAMTAALMAMIVTGQQNQIQGLRRDGTQPEAAQYLNGWLPQSKWALAFITFLILGAFMTVVTNGDPLFYGPLTLPGLRLYDALSVILTAIVALLPLLLARRYLASPEAHRILIVAVAVAGLAYSLPALFEVRMSPQLNRWVYGFFPHSWFQHVRGDGFRPLVFLEHGLKLSIFLSASVLAALGMIRIGRAGQRGLWAFAAVWLMITLVLSKSLGALALTLLLGPLVVVLPTRMLLLGAALSASLVVSFPVLRSTGIMPVETVVKIASVISEERAQSFAFRLGHEELLLDKALERPAFGWGGWGRSRVFNDQGKDVSITDGYWIIILGAGGWLRYLAEFGLLCAPLILLVTRYGHVNPGLETGILAALLAGNLMDLIPNAGISPLTWLMAGALWGRLELARQAASDPQGAATRVPMPERRFGRHQPQGQLARRLEPRGTAPAAAAPEESPPPRRPAQSRSAVEGRSSYTRYPDRAPRRPV